MSRTLLLFLFTALPALGQQPLTFAQLCAQPETINCWGFESETELAYTSRTGPCDSDPFLLGHPNGQNGFGLDRQTLGNVIVHDWNQAGRCMYPKRDATYSTSGGYSLKFTMPSNSGDQTSGDFTDVFKRHGTSSGNYRFTRFGPGGEFWLRFKIRESPELTTTRLRSRSGGIGTFGGIKRVIIHGYESSETLEETIHDGWERRVPQMYSNSGTEDYGVQDFINCDRRNPDVAASYAMPPCRPFIPNLWRTFQVHVRVADNAQRTNGLVELYVDDEATPIIRVTNAEMGSATGPAYSESAIWDDVTNGYGKFSFTLYSTNKDPTQVHPEAHMWIDDVVISRVRVPPLLDHSGSPQGDSVAPAPPAGLRVRAR